MTEEICPVGFDCLVMADLQECPFTGLLFCPNRTFCLAQVRKRKIQPLLSGELSVWSFYAFYDPPDDGVTFDDVAHYKFVRFFGCSYNHSEILDLIKAGFAEPVRIDAVSHNFGVVSAVDYGDHRRYVECFDDDDDSYYDDDDDDDPWLMQRLAQ